MQINLRVLLLFPGKVKENIEEGKVKKRSKMVAKMGIRHRRFTLNNGKLIL